jgi:hypothetical protein
MPKPTSKDELLQASRQERSRLEDLLDAQTPEQLTTPGVVGAWSPKDVLAHLVEWEQMVLRWLATSQAGGQPAVPGEGYNWGQLPELNHQIYLQQRARSLPDVLADFHTSHQEVMARIESLPEETLFTPGLYPWMNNNILAAYFNSCTASHYRWACNEIRKGLKRLEIS